MGAINEGIVVNEVVELGHPIENLYVFRCFQCGHVHDC
jgi:hypothetical protein